LPIGKGWIALNVGMILHGSRLSAIRRKLCGPETLHDRGRCIRMALQPHRDGGARGRPGLVDQAQCKLCVLPLLLGGMVRPLDVERRQRKEQTRRHIGARPVSEGCRNVVVRRFNRRQVAFLSIRFSPGQL
jgi:hypothetical protein